MKLAIVIVILAFCCCGSHGNPSACSCGQSGEMESEYPGGNSIQPVARWDEQAQSEYPSRTPKENRIRRLTVGYGNGGSFKSYRNAKTLPETKYVGYAAESTPPRQRRDSLKPAWILQREKAQKETDGFNRDDYQRLLDNDLL